MDTPTMHAVQVHAAGGPEQLVIDSIPRPTPREHELLIRIDAAGVNPLDWKIREGIGPVRPANYPYTPGTDFAGIIEEAGPGVTSCRTGQAVYGQSSTHQGAYAEYIATSMDSVAPMPANLDFAEAASVPAGALTAWQALFDHGKLEAGQRVLVHGAAGGVGLFAVQLAKWSGATVFGTASPTNEEFMHELGVDVFIDYQSTRFEHIARDMDLVVDTVGGDTLDRSWHVLKPAGRLIILGTPPATDKARQHRVHAIKMVMQPRGDQLRLITHLIEAGQIKPVVATRFSLSEAHRAQQLSESRHGRGRIVLEVAH